MNEFIVWDKTLECFRLSDYVKLENGILKPIGEDYTIYKGIGLKDINGKKIYADCSIVEFEHKYKQRAKKQNGIYTLENFHTEKTEILQAFFTWNNEELRYELDILNHDFFVCLDFTSTMKNFKIIDTIQENKLGLIK